MSITANMGSVSQAEAIGGTKESSFDRASEVLSSRLQDLHKLLAGLAGDLEHALVPDGVVAPNVVDSVTPRDPGSEVSNRMAYFAGQVADLSSMVVRLRARVDL